MESSRSGTATVLVTDLVDSTVLRTRLGDERADQLRRAHDRLVRSAVAANGGEEVKTTGDGFVITFSAAADALACAQAVQQAMARFNRRGRDKLSVRIGLSSGDVRADDGDCFGSAVIEAERLCGGATGGQILASEITRLLAPPRVREEARPACGDAFEIGWDDEPGGRPLPDSLCFESTMPFIGRTSALDSLRRAWEYVEHGGRGVVLVSGEPGVGKTRLIAELAAEVHRSGGTVLAGRCDQDLDVPYQPFAEAIGFAVRTGDPAQVIEALGTLGGELERLVPDLRNRVPALAAPLAAEPETERYRLFEAVRDLLGALAQQRPVLLVLDDLHWASRPTLLLLQHLVRTISLDQLLIVGTWRHTDVGRDHHVATALDAVQRQPGVQRLVLQGFDDDEAVQFLAAAAGHDLPPNGRDLATMLRAETDGNPFFISEVLRHLTERGDLVVTDGYWSSARSVEQIGIPDGVREVVDHRLGRLEVGAVRALTVGAVLGREFDARIVAEVAGRSLTDILDGLEEAEAARLVASVPDVPGRFSFAHALVRSAVYDDLPVAQRVRLHDAAARSLEASGTARPSDLAHHALAASPLDPERAVRCARAAAEQAVARLAFEEAASLFRRALTLLESTEFDPSERIDLQLQMGMALQRGGDARYRETLLGAARGANEFGDRDREVAAILALLRLPSTGPLGDLDAEVVGAAHALVTTLDDSQVADRARVLGALSVVYQNTAEWNRQAELADEALALARGLGDELTLAAVLAYVSWSALRPDLPAGEAEALAAELVALAHRVGEPEAECLGLNLLAWARMAQADRDGAMEAHARYSELVDELRHPFHTWGREVDAVILAAHDGDLEGAEARASATFELAESCGVPPSRSMGTFGAQIGLVRLLQGRIDELAPMFRNLVDQQPDVVGWQAALALALAESGDTEGARRELDAIALRGIDAVPRDIVWWLCLQLLALAGDAIDGHPATAAPLYEALPAHAGRFPMFGTVSAGPVDLALALAARRLGRLDEAKAHIRAAAAICVRVQSPTWLALVHAVGAEIAADAGDFGEARDLAHEARGAGMRLGMAGVVARADRILMAAAA